MDEIQTYNYVKGLFKYDVDKGGSPYIGHLERVSNKCKNVSGDAVLIGMLHDVIEDKAVNDGMLLAIGYSLNVVESVKLLSRLEGVSYSDYIDNLLKYGNLDALCVKRADLEDNMDIGRLSEITEKDINRLETRYIPTWKKVVKRIEDIKKKDGVLV